MAVGKLIFQIVDPLVGGDLEDDGIQYSTEVDTTTVDTDVTVLEKTIDHGLTGTLLVLEAYLTAELKAVSSGTADVKWKWQARNEDGTWVDLMADYVTESNIGTTYVSRSRSGYKFAVANLNAVPLDVRLIMQCNEANEGRAKVKNSSKVIPTYTVDI